MYLKYIAFVASLVFGNIWALEVSEVLGTLNAKPSTKLD